MNNGAGYRLEIPVNFKFFGAARAIQWAENTEKKVIQNIDQRVKHCKKQFFKENICLFTLKLFLFLCPLYRVYF